MFQNFWSFQFVTTFIPDIMLSTDLFLVFTTCFVQPSVILDKNPYFHIEVFCNFFVVLLHICSIITCPDTGRIIKIRGRIFVESVAQKVG